MNEGIWVNLLAALRLLISFESTTYAIILRSLLISGIALIVASALAIPLAGWIALRRFRGKNFVVAALNTCMGIPTVALGLLVYMFFSRSGPGGVLGLLFTPGAMIIAQTILAFPIICALSISAVSRIDKSLIEAAITLGASRLQTIWVMMKEAKVAVLTAVMAAFGRIVTEVGAAMIVGGNIKGTTRIMTTAIALETSKGNFETALSLAIVLFLIAFLINGVVYRFR